MNIFMTEPQAGGIIGKCPIFGDTVELIDSIKELPENSKIVDGNEFYTRYKCGDLVLVKKKTTQRVINLDEVPIEFGGNKKAKI